MEKKFAIIGHFGGNKNFTDGQTIKTVTLYNAMTERGYVIDKVDTYLIKRKPLNFLKSMLKAVKNNSKIVVLLSINGRRLLFPYLAFISKTNKDIYHYAIGGRLFREVSQHKSWRLYVSSFRGNWVESRILANQLNNIGINNAKYIPNFKRIKILQENDLNFRKKESYNFCIFSRVMPEKGIEDAILAIKEINEKGFGKAVLDIYGPIEPKYEERFKSLVCDNKNIVNYCGVVKPEKSVDVLKDYYMLLFPTHWKHEGIPGTIVDALSAGVPIIARQWQYCDEMITDGKTGLVYDFEHPEILVQKIQYAVENENKIVSMKKQCLLSAQYYSESVAIKAIQKEMGFE